MFRFHRAVAVGSTLAAAILLAACGGGKSSSTTAGEGLKVGFVYVGPLPGSGWALAWDGARQDLVRKFGAQTSVAQPIPESPSVLPILQSFLRNGDKLIFVTGIGYQPFVLQIARQSPNVDFVVVGPWVLPQPRPRNVASVFGNLWGVRYLSGIVAASMSKRKQLGFVSAFSIPSVVAGINGFEQGAKSVDPGVKTKVVLTNSWYDPPGATQASETLASSGADVIAQHMDDIGGCLGAKATGAWCIGSEANASAEMPATYLTGSVYDWSKYAEKKYEQALHGTFTNEEFDGDLADGLIQLGTINSAVPPSVKAKVLAAETRLKAGKLVVFKGPLYSNTGKLILPAGQSWSTPDQVYAHMTFFEQGIIGHVAK